MKIDISERYHILIVEDNPDHLNVLMNILETGNYELRIATDAQSALEILKFERVDLILLDIMLPGMNGFELCKTLKSEPATEDIPVIFMTALNDTVNKIKGLELGAVDYITKPFQVGEVIARIKIHLKLRQLMEKEKEVSNLRAYFISMASHDMRSPLNSVMSIAYMLKQFEDKLSPEDKIKKLEVIERSSKRMIDILDNILTLNQVTTSKQIIYKEKTDYIKFCQEMAEELPILFQNTHIIKLQAEATDIQIRMDQKVVWHILYNLVNNAMKYSLPGSKIVIRVFTEGPEVVTQVIDQGIGIPESEQQKIFESYFRGSNVGETKGSGLGLSIVRQLVALHEGRITAESEAGNGSIFSIYFPINDI